jgi:peptide/nickel transport system permease protein
VDAGLADEVTEHLAEPVAGGGGLPPEEIRTGGSDGGPALAEADGTAWGFAGQVGLRAAWFAATILGAAWFVQVLLWAAPGDPIDLLPNGEDLRPLLEREWGLDSPLVVRYFRFVGHALTGDFGTSLTVHPGSPVRDLVVEASVRSMGLLVPSLVVSLLSALGLAWWTAGTDSKVRGLVQVLSVGPVFLLAYLTVVGLNEAAFALKEAGYIAALPAWHALPVEKSALRTALAIGAMALGSGCLTELHGACEDELVRIRTSGFIDAVRARGGRAAPHVLPNLVAPLASLAMSRIGFLVGGLVVVEKVLLLNGAGALMWEACLKRDYPLAMGLAIAAALFVSLANLLGDIVRFGIDPRLRRQG